MALSKFFKSLAVAVSCILAVGFLLLIVDEGTITGKMTAVTSASTATPTIGVNVWVFIILIFFFIAAGIIIFLKKKNLFLKK